jgi:carbonic anhydrase
MAANCLSMTVSIRASLLLSALGMAALTAAFASPESIEKPAGHAAKASHWTYGGEGGPEHWGELDPANMPCAIGKQQSPIDLSGALSAVVATPVPRWIPARGGEVVNNGHTLQVNLAEGGSVKLDGKDYVLKQFHFHHPSEHTIDGKAFPLEVHFVNAAADGDLAVVGVLFEEGTANPNLDAIWSTAPTQEGEVHISHTLDAGKFMPATAGVFRYEGSLTTPPCSETVRWTVMATPITASASQIAAFASLFPHNARPVQPLNRRYVLKTAD